jgi:hypothetical protein
MLKQVQVKRANVTVDDRRAVLVIAQARKPKDVAEMSHENFIRNALKDRLAWPRREPAPESVKQAAKHMAQSLMARDKARWAAEKKAAAEREAKEAEKAAQVKADEERWALSQYAATLNPSAQALVEALAIE